MDLRTVEQHLIQIRLDALALILPCGLCKQIHEWGSGESGMSMLRSDPDAPHNLKIDGRTAANIVQGGRYDESVPAGRHTLTVSAVPNYQPTSTVLNVQHGQTYVFTAIRQNADSVVLVPSALPPGQQ